MTTEEKLSEAKKERGWRELQARFAAAQLSLAIRRAAEIEEVCARLEAEITEETKTKQRPA